MFRTKLHPIGGVNGGDGIDPQRWNGVKSAEYAKKLDKTLMDKQNPIKFEFTEKAPGGNTKGKTYEITLENGFVATFVDDGDGKISEGDVLKKIVVDGKEMNKTGWMEKEIKNATMNREACKAAKERQDSMQKLSDHFDSSQTNGLQPEDITYTQDLNGNKTYNLGSVKIGDKTYSLTAKGKTDNQGVVTIAGFEFRGKTYSCAQSLQLKGNPKYDNAQILDYAKMIADNELKKEAAVVAQLDADYGNYTDIGHYAENEK